MVASVHNDWFLKQWLDSLHTTQAELERRTGWDKRKASHLVNCKQPYKRDTLNEAAMALHLEPFELLMHPDDAHALRRLRATALQIAADKSSPWHGFEPVDIAERDGTHG